MNIPASSTPPVAIHSLLSPVRILAAGLSALIASPSGAVTPPEQIALVEHWDAAGNPSPVVHSTLNSISHKSPLASAQVGSSEYIFYTYINTAGNIAVRRIEENQLNYAGAQYMTEYLLRDSAGAVVVAQNDPSHVGPSIGIDGDGYLHVAGNIHNQSWQYWVSNYPRDVLGGFTFKGKPLSTADRGPNTDASGKFISPPGYAISYPYFANDRNGRLYVSFRHWVAKSAGGPAPYYGCWGAGGIAQYNNISKRWKMIGGTDYTLPATTITYPAGAAKQRATFYQGYGAPNSDTPWYQSYNIEFWFDPNNWMRVATALYTDDYPNDPAISPTKAVYAQAAMDGTDAEGFVKWKFLKTDETTWLTGDHTLTLGNGNLHTVMTKSLGDGLGTPCNVGVVEATGGNVRPMVKFVYQMNPEWGSTCYWWAYRDFSPAWNWYRASPTLNADGTIAASNLPGTYAQFASQGIWGRKFLTGFSGGVWRSNDKGASKRTYNIWTGLATGWACLDARYNNAYTQNATVEKIRYVSGDANFNARIYTLQIRPDNLLGDGAMTTQPVSYYWNPWSGVATFSTTGGSGNSSCYQMPGAATVGGIEKLRVEPGKIMNVSVWARASTATGAKLRFLFYVYNSDGAMIATAGGSTTINAFPGDRVPTTTAQTFTATMNIPTTVGSPAQAPYYISAILQNVSAAPAPTIWVDDVKVAFQ